MLLMLLLQFASSTFAEVPEQLLQDTQGRKSYLYNLFFDSDFDETKMDQFKVLTLSAQKKIPIDEHLIDCVFNYVSRFGTSQTIGKDTLPNNTATRILHWWFKFLPTVRETPLRETLKNTIIEQNFYDVRDVRVQIAFSLSNEWPTVHIKKIAEEFALSPQNLSEDAQFIKRVDTNITAVLTLKNFITDNSRQIKPTELMQTFMHPGLQLKDLRFLPPLERLNALNFIYEKLYESNSAISNFKSKIEPDYAQEYKLAYDLYQKEIQKLSVELSEGDFYLIHLKNFELQTLAHARGITSIQPKLHSFSNKIVQYDYLDRIWNRMLMSYQGKIPPQSLLAEVAYFMISKLEPGRQRAFYDTNWSQKQSWQVPLIQNMMEEAKQCPPDLLKPSNDVGEWG